MPTPTRPKRSNAPRLIALAAVLLSITWSLFASAGGISFSGTYPLRIGTHRLADPPTGTTTGTTTVPTTGGGTVTNYGINRGDCLGISNGTGSDTRWQFAINQPLTSYQYLEVWVRTDSNAGCSDPAARGVTGLAPLCAKVATFANSKVNANQIFEVPDVAFIAAFNPTKRITDDASSGFATDKAARDTVCSVSGSQDPINLYISFLLTSDTAGTLAGGGVVYELIYATTYDLAGPLPPVISLGAGDTLLKASWDLGSAAPPQNFIGYQAYCFPIGTPFDGGTTDTGGLDTTPGTDTAVADTGVADTGLADSGVDADDADTAVDDTAASIDTSTTSTDTGTVADTTATDAGVTPPAPTGCNGALPAGFAEGQLPTAEIEQYQCGSRVSATSDNVQIDHGYDGNPLKNLQQYAIAIGGVDTYNNTGVLSNVICGTPKETVDFFDAFRSAGGTAGGGYCTYAPVGPVSGLAMMGIAALGLVMRLVRRRKGV